MKHYVFALVCLIVSVNLLGTSEKKTVFHPQNGSKVCEYEVDGVHLNGLFVSYYENGQVKAKGYLKNNRKSGLWTAWYPNGVMHSQRKYVDNDSFHIVNAWDSNGVATNLPAAWDPATPIASSPMHHSTDSMYITGDELFDFSQGILLDSTGIRQPVAQ